MELADFSHYLRVRYGECDTQRVVFNARYGDYVDVAFTEFLRAIGYGLGAAEPLPEVQLVQQTTQWRGPARNDQILRLTVRCLRVGNTSFVIRTEFFQHGADIAFANTETVYVHVDQAFTKAPLPAAFANALLAGAKGQCSDHAGALPRS
jgi:acyl-CoA thioester hydrolase